MSRLALLLLFALVAVPAVAQSTEETPMADAAEMTESAEMADEAAPAEGAADARTAYTQKLEEAQAAAEADTAEGYLQAASLYLEARDIAAESGDDELVPFAASATESAVASYKSAGDAYKAAAEAAGEDEAAAATAYMSAAEQFVLAADLTSGLDNAGNEATLRYFAGDAYADGGDFENGMAQLNTAIELAPEEYNFQLVRAQVMMKSGDMEGAQTSLTELIATTEEAGESSVNSMAGQMLGMTYLRAANAQIKDKDYSAGIATLDEAAPLLGEDNETLNKLYAGAYYRLGAAQVQSESFGPAQSNLEQALAYARRAGMDRIVGAAQQQLDYIAEVSGN
ncbi:MAG: hypothetical protein AAFN13_00535 [Bacteroidota bacterium]